MPIESSPELPADPDAIPDGAPVQLLDKWIGQAQAAIDAAQASGNVPLLGQMLRVAASLAETRRKAAPPVRPDPNEHPDMLEAKEKARSAFHRLIEHSLIEKVLL